MVGRQVQPSDLVRIRGVMSVAIRTLIGSAALLLVLGVVVWTGNGDGLIPLHVGLGVVLVLCLWAIALIAARSGVPRWIPALAASWGGLAVALGLVQDRLVAGRWHWTVQVAHLVVSMGAVAWGRALAGLMRRTAIRAAGAMSGSAGAVAG
jgi:hypothetical protein